jgi:hypothetical protein
MHQFRLLPLLALLAAGAWSRTVVHLENGNDQSGDITGVDANSIELTDSGKARKIPIRFMAGLDTNGTLVNGPFDAASLRALAGLPAEDPIPAPAGAPIAQTESERQKPPYLRYGVVIHQGMMTYIPGSGPGGVGGMWTGGGGSMTTQFSRCPLPDLESCGPGSWIGFTGEDLQAAVAPVPEARAIADRIKITTLVQAVSLVATPIFLFSAVSAANGPRDEYGRVSSHVGPGAMTLFVLTGASFANYIGWNIYEKSVARKAIRVYNASLGLDDRAGSRIDVKYGF